MNTKELRGQSPEGILPGDKFGQLTVIGFYGRNPNHQALWATKCVCGKLSKVLGCNLKKGNSTSCGIHRKYKAIGTIRTPEYRAWCAMKRRCLDVNNRVYHLYGGRGIQICKRWLTSFNLFLKDVGKRPSEHHSLDRINNNYGYFPTNVRWATKTIQSRNTSLTRMLTINGITKPEIEWAEGSGISLMTIRARVNRGWPISEILSSVKWKHRIGRCD